jgi:asparagine synthase (glutamine-hydrolysing)
VCGIAGIISLHRDCPVDPAWVQAMTDAMAHRGPDGQGLWCSPDASVILGHRRLSIVDLSAAGAQPMLNEDQQVVISFNGEIYNYRDFVPQLKQHGHIFRSQTDTEVLLHLYEQHGERMLEQLAGDFAFGIWDQRTRSLLLARDRAGVKPLYYVATENFFVFASELRAILASGLVEAEINETALYHYLTFLVSPCPTSLIKNVRKLEIGSALRLNQTTGSITLKRYWEPFPGQYRSRGKDLDSELEELFADSVRSRLMADVPVGTLFSGGVDSTLNTLAFQREISPRQVQTFNVGNSDTPDYQDESSFAAEMAAKLGCIHHQIKITEAQVLSSVEDIAGFQDEPISDPVCIPLYFVTKLARQAGVYVLHAGEGADELFCGYPKYQTLLRQQRCLWQPLELLPKFVSSALYAAARQCTSSHLVGGKIADILRRRSLGQGFFLSSAVAYFEHEKQSILSADFRRRMQAVDSYQVVAEIEARLEAHKPNCSFLERMTFIELNLRLPELLLGRTDKISMANSVEVRVPFLDHKLIEFALSMPESFTLRDQIAKEPIKRLALKFGAERQDIYRPKSGFGAPIQSWFDRQLGQRFLQILSEDRALVSRYFDAKALERMIRQPNKNPNQAFQLWVVFNFLIWHKSINVKARELRACASGFMQPQVARAHAGA